MRKRTTQLSVSLAALAFSPMASPVFSQVDWNNTMVDLGDPTIVVDVPTIELPPIIITPFYRSGLTFSVDFQGPTAGHVPGPFTGTPDSWAGVRIDEGSILTPGYPSAPGPNSPSAGPLPTPGVMVTAVNSAVGSVPGGLGIQTASPFKAVELDALSYGRDSQKGRLFFSVDEFASGDQVAGAAGGPMPPNVYTEGVGAGGGPGFEAAADVFRYLGRVTPTSLPAAIGPGNTAVYDGNGLPGAGAPPNAGLGLGLVEGNWPGQGPQDEGDNLDALDMNTGKYDLRHIFFSMDARFVDPLEAIAGAAPPNTNTAAGNGFSAADVVVSVPGGVPQIYAKAEQLGLDKYGFNSDDLDALSLRDDGRLDSATQMPYFDPANDVIYFSVRRGSQLIGTPDSRLGLKIEEGDILTVGFDCIPEIFIPAEAMGLGTLRSGTAGQFGADDLNAMDVLGRRWRGDANRDGVVTGTDLIVIQQNFGASAALDGLLDGDANDDGLVTGMDLIEVQQTFGQVESTDAAVVAAVPEPATIALMSAGLLFMRKTRRTR